MQKLWHYFWKSHLRQSESLIITWFHRIFSKHAHVCWKFGESWISLDFKKICKKIFKWRSNNHLVFGKYAKVMALILKIPNGAKRARKVGIYDGQLSGHQESFLGRQFWPQTFRWVLVGTGGYGWVPVGTGGYRWVPVGTGGYRWVPAGTDGYRWVPVSTSGYWWPLVESKYYIVTNLDCYKLRLLQT